MAAGTYCRGYGCGNLQHHSEVDRKSDEILQCLYFSQYDKQTLPDWPHLGKDNLVDVCDEDGRFYYVRIAGKYFGFVEKQYIVNASNPPAPTPVPKPTGFPFMGEVMTAVNLRTSPKNLGILNYCNIEAPAGTPIRHTLQKGEQVTVIGENGGWWQLQIVGKYTWTPWCAKKDGNFDIIRRI